MAAITSTANGNWSATGTWVGGVVPTDGDTVTIAHNVAVDTNITIGNSPTSTGKVITVNTTKTLTFNAGVAVACKGGILQKGSAIIQMEAGSGIEFDSSASAAPSTTRYTWEVGDSHNAKPRIQINGTAEARCYIRSKAGSAYAWINDGTADQFLQAGLIQGQYVTITRMGDADTKSWRMSPTGDSIVSLKHARLDTCGRIGGLFNWGADATVEFDDINMTGSVDSENICFKTENATSIGAGTRIFKNFSADLKVQFFTWGGIQTENNYFHRSIENTVDQEWGSFKYNFVRFSPGFGEFNISGDTLDNIYFYDDPDQYNPHFISALESGEDQTIDGDIFDMNCLQEDDPQEGDCIQIGEPGDACTVTIQNVIIPKGPSNRTVGTLFTAAGNADTTIIAIHNTVHTGSQGAAVGETYSGFPGMVDTFKSNIFWDEDGGQGKKLYDAASSTVSDLVAAADADYNCGWNLIAGTNGKGYSGLEFSSGSPGDHDLNVNPNFVNKDADLSTWDASLGGPGTDAHAMQELQKIGLATYNTAFSAQAFTAYMRAAFTPTNPALKNAAHDGGDIGAVPVGVVTRNRNARMMMGIG